MKKEDWDKELMRLEKKYRLRLVLGWIVLSGLITWLVFNIL